MKHRFLSPVAAIAVLLVMGTLLGRSPTVGADVISSTIPIEGSPRVVAVAPNGKVYIASRIPDRLTVIDASSGAIIKTFPPIFSEPGAVHIGSDGRVYVPNRTGNTLTVIDSLTDTVIQTVPVGLRPAAIDTPDDNSKVVVADERSGTVTILNQALASIATLPVAPSRAPHTLVVTPSGSKAYVACEATNEIVVVNLAAAIPVISGRISVGASPGSMHLVGGTLFVANQGAGTLSLIDTNSDAVTRTVTVGNAPHGIAVTPDHSRVLVANEASGTISVLTASGNAVTTIDLRANPADASGRPQRIHITDDGARAYVPNEEAGTVSVIDLASMSVIQTLTAGSMPTSLDIAAGHVFVANLSTNDVSMVQIQASSAGATDTPVPATGDASATPRPSATSAPASTPAPGDTPVPEITTTLDPAQTPSNPDATGDGTSGTVLGGAATPVGTVNTVSGTTTPSGSSTPARTTTPTSRTPTRTPTRAAGDIKPEGSKSTPPPSSGGAPSWIWLAAALLITSAFGAGGYLLRDRISALMARK